MSHGFKWTSLGEQEGSSPLVQDFIKVVPVQVHILEDGSDVGGVVGLGVLEQSLSQLVNLLVLRLAAVVLARNVLMIPRRATIDLSLVLTD